jgi:sugar phosphate isomerase/epimerase
MGLPVALQLYTVRDETSKDFRGTLEKVAEMGYQGVEFAGFGDIPAAEMKELLERLNLKAAGSHTGKDMLAEKMDEIIEYNLGIGNKYVLCAHDKYDSKEGWLEAAKFYGSVGKKLKDNGLQFGYHNHAHEFVKYDGEYALDILYSHTDPDIVKTEIDVYWAYYAGVDPAAYIRKYTGRCPLVHLKDMRADDRDFAEIGEGIIDIRSIIEVSEKAGTEWIVVEQDTCRRPSLESAKISIKNIMKM